jgi:hypothetical protein
METLQALADSEIPFQIDTSVTGWFTVMLGDESNGFVAKWSTRNIGEAVTWLETAATEHFPDSYFAQSLVRPEQL